jgi:hypothetical protein
LPQKVSNIQIKLGVNNPDGVTDHTVVNLEKCHIDLGSQPFDFRMLLKTPVSDQWIDAGAKGRIDLTQMQKFMKIEAGTKLAGIIDADVSVKGSIAAAQKKQFEQLDAKGTIGIKDLTYASKDYPDGVVIYNLMMAFTPKNVTVTGLRGQYLKTIFSGDGTIDNMLGYYLHNEALAGKFNFVADKIDCNKWMGTSPAPATTTAAPPATEPFIVPNNLDIEFHASVGTLVYDNITLTAVQGGMAIKNETVTLEGVQGKGFDGLMKMSGTYSTKKDKKNPDIQFTYNIEAVDVPKIYAAFPTAQKMMPAGKYISGKITTNFTMNGKLTPDMSPVMNSLNGKGDMMLLSGVLSNFPVTDKLMEVTHLTQFKTISLKDMKIFFSFENGRVTVQPYKLKIGDIDAEIAGSHGFDQTMKYGANLVVPRAMMGAQANALVNNLLGQATSKGIPIKLGDKVNLTVNITGTTTSPKIETNLKNIAGDAVTSVKDEIKKEVARRVDSVKNVVKDTVKAIKTEVTTKAKEAAKEEIKQIIADPNKKPADAVKDAGEKAKEGLKGLFKRK